VIEVVRGSIVISHSRPHYDLQDLLVGMSPENVHPEFAIDDPSHRTDHPPSEGTPI
jgi:antitoxin component of MazEF toxin-antitoxin module